MAGGDAVSKRLDRWAGYSFEDRQVHRSLDEGAKHRCATCGHNSFEHSTGPMNANEFIASLDSIEKIPTPCNYCGCGSPESIAIWWRTHHDCPQPCECRNYIWRDEDKS